MGKPEFPAPLKIEQTLPHRYEKEHQGQFIETNDVISNQDVKLSNTLYRITLSFSLKKSIFAKKKSIFAEKKSIIAEKIMLRSFCTPTFFSSKLLAHSILCVLEDFSV